MSETEHLEKQLRSWSPRRPSAVIERTLFGHTEPEESPALSVRLNWFGPAMALLLLFCALFNQHNAMLSGSSQADYLAGLALSNQSSAAYLPGSFAREHNNLPIDRLEWSSSSATRTIPTTYSYSSNRFQ